jgi:hypothetical protein
VLFFNFPGPALHQFAFNLTVTTPEVFPDILEEDVGLSLLWPQTEQHLLPHLVFSLFHIPSL